MQMGLGWSGCLLVTPLFRVGDPRTEGYLEWHEWARIQYRGGLRQTRGADGKWRFPSE